jgi:transcriptional regulator with XRE-family HTH domain
MSKEPNEEKAIKELGLNIRKLRKNQNLSRYQLSKQSGVDYASLYRIESGQNEAKYTTILKIINGLKITPSDFFRDIDLSFL